jgi:hypothetical protein
MRRLGLQMNFDEESAREDQQQLVSTIVLEMVSFMFFKLLF